MNDQNPETNGRNERKHVEKNATHVFQTDRILYLGMVVGLF